MAEFNVGDKIKLKDTTSNRDRWKKTCWKDCFEFDQVVTVGEIKYDGRQTAVGIRIKEALDNGCSTVGRFSRFERFEPEEKAFNETDELIESGEMIIVTDVFKLDAFYKYKDDIIGREYEVVRSYYDGLLLDNNAPGWYGGWVKNTEELSKVTDVPIDEDVCFAYIKVKKIDPSLAKWKKLYREQENV